MSNVQWIKLTTDMFDDEKIKIIEHMPEADTILIIWIKLLAQAGKTNASGYIFLNENIPFSDEMLSTIFNRPLATVRLALQTLNQFGMINITDANFIEIANWGKHQNVQGLDKIREQARIRQARYRDNKALAESNATVTLRNDTELELDLELDLELEVEKEKDIEQVAKAPVINKAKKIEEDFNELWKLYPNKKGKANALKAYAKAIKNGTSYETVEKGLLEFQKHCQTNDWYSPAHGSTWFNGERWNDEYDTGGTSNGANRPVTKFDDGLNF